ncbi:hypothetical protein R5R35_006910 [Gryllus longicercus]|uniref:26S proteasome non-ATPase regulatory subunit 5 n=1 Tax=Gryllus longicercus TaxID=2509291 RepID=A0AAN9VYF0_9ORTH
MCTNFQWFQTKVFELRSDCKRAEILTELKSAMKSKDESQQKYIAQNLQLEEAFDCLTSSEKEVVDVAGQILSLSLGSLDSNVVLGQYLDHLKRALCQSSVTGKKLAVDELYRAAHHSELVSTVSQLDILESVVTCLKSSDIALAKSASALLVKLGEYPSALDVIFSQGIIETLKCIQTKGDITRFRVFEVTILIATHSLEGLCACENNGFLKTLVKELESEDVIMQLNALELLSKLARQSHGLVWLQEHGILRLLADKMLSIEEEPLGHLLLPGLLKMFGIVAQNSPKHFFDHYPEVLTLLFESFDTSDMNLLGIAMDTLGCVARSVEGKLMLYNHGDQAKSAIKKIAHAIQTFPQLHKARALKAMADIVELKRDVQESHVLQITKDFFHWVSDEPLTLVMEIFENQFPKLRLAGLHLLRVLAEQEWGQMLIEKQPGIIEFLLDRVMESHKYCKNGKIAVVKTIVESPTSSSVFGSETVAKLKKSIQIRVQTPIVRRV